MSSVPEVAPSDWLRVCQAADPKGFLRRPAPGTDERAEHVSEELFKLIVNGGADDATMSALVGVERPYSDRSEGLRCRVAELEARLLRGSAMPKEELARLAASLPTTGSARVEQALRNLRAAEGDACTASHSATTRGSGHASG